MAMTQQQWVTMTEAARRTGVSVTKISNMVRDRELSSREDPRDKRKRLVDLAECLRILGTA